MLTSKKENKKDEEKKQKEKKRQREEERKWKAEEKTRTAGEKKCERWRKRLTRQEKSWKAAESSKKAKTAMKQKAKADGVDSPNTRSEMQPPQKAAQMQAMHQVDNINDGEYCMCFTTYEEDVRDKSRKEWVACGLC